MNSSDIKRNFIIYSVDGALFSMALVFISYENILPVLLSRLGASSLAISFIPVFITLGTNIPGIFFVRKTQGLTHRKNFIIRWGIGQRLPWLLAGLLLPVLYDSHSEWLTGLFLASVLIVTLSTGVMMPAFYDLISLTVPTEKRGMLMAIRSGISYLLGIGCGFIVRDILARTPFPHNYSALYLIGFVLFCLNLAVFSLIREPDGNGKSSGDSYWVTIWHETWHTLKENKSFRWFLLVRSLLILSYSTCAFFPVYLIDRFSLNDHMTGTFVIIAGITYVLMNPLLGRIGDKKGYRMVMIINAAVFLAASIWGLVNVGMPLALGLVAFAAVGRTGNLLMNNMAIEYAPPGKVPLYIGVGGLVVGLVSPLGLFSGLIVGYWGYYALFVMTGMTSLGALAAALVFLKEPRSHKQRL